MENEALKQGLEQNQIDYVFAELNYYKSLRAHYLPIVGEPSIIDGVWQNDSLISTVYIKQKFLEEMKLLEDSIELDWQPNTNETVRNLIHPSLYPLLITKTIQGRPYCETEDLDYDQDPIVILERMSKRKKITPAPTISREYQWLPAEFKIDSSGNVEIQSTINNLHPKFKSTYDIIGKVFSRFVPLFDQVLTDLLSPSKNRINSYNWYDYKADDVNYKDVNADVDDDDYNEFDKYKFIKPSIPKFDENAELENYKSKKMYTIKGKTVQVIVKIATILLTPEKSKYDFGDWHVEGMQNESIVASGIYYYESKNITDSRIFKEKGYSPTLLSFRRAVCDPLYPQNDDKGVLNVYNLESGNMMNEFLGSIETVEDRCIAFPNILQHRVEPFELLDKTQPGTRKIMVFFLVDPNKRITSTLEVPYQQRSWLLEELTILDKHLVDIVLDYCDWIISREQAHKHRALLMSERKKGQRKINEEIYNREFSLCEH